MGRTLCFCFLIAAAAGPLPGQQSRTDSGGQAQRGNGGALFPANWLRGYADFEFAPPTNEPDLGRCRASAGSTGGGAACAAFARYVLGGYIEARPFAGRLLNRVFLFAAPRMFAGNNLPQVNYTASANPIALESLAGAGIALGDNFELRAVRHAVYWLGRYRGNLGAADLGPNGPYGHYATIGLRWYFGGYGGQRTGL